MRQERAREDTDLPEGTREQRKEKEERYRRKEGSTG